MMHPPVSILIPAYGSAEKLRVCLDSLARHLPEGGWSTCVLDDATPDNTVQLVCEEAKKGFSELSYLRSQVNRGFVGTCNWGRKELLKPGHDLLLLNSDTEVTAGFLEEMQTVLHMHEKHAVVTPRSNNATIFSIPWSGERLPPADSYALWQRVHCLLPRFQVMPTAVGFCMLIKAQVVTLFDLFDEVYSPGYNEENDFVCRINRYGYSAVAANWAYVFHHESASFGSRRAALDASHRRILLERFPEYERIVGEYARFHVDPVDVFAELWAPHRPRILFDLFHLEAKHSGTSDFALNLLREVHRLLEAEFDLYVGIGEALPFFSQELRGYRIYEDCANSRMSFDLLYKPCQVFTWIDFARMTRLSPRIAYTLQDIIGVRCRYLSGANREILFHKTAELADRVFTISNFSRDDFQAFYGSEVTMQVIYHGTNVGAAEGEFRKGEYVLVMGNSFAHKGVSEALANLHLDLPVVVLGGKSSETKIRQDMRMLESGSRSRQQMRDVLARARVVVYPSHYEGFGLPVIDALASGKPVVVLDSAVNRELAGLLDDPNLHRIASLHELNEAVELAYKQTGEGIKKAPRRWRAAGEEYVAAWRELLARDIDVPKLRARFATVRMIQSVGG
jgi:GT2 family glycosyltransferase